MHANNRDGYLLFNTNLPRLNKAVVCQAYLSSESLFLADIAASDWGWNWIISCNRMRDSIALPCSFSIVASFNMASGTRSLLGYELRIALKFSLDKSNFWETYKDSAIQ